MPCSQPYFSYTSPQEHQLHLCHILSLNIMPCKVMGVLFSSILYLCPPSYSFFPYYCSHPFFQIHFHLPSSLPAVTINFLVFLGLVYVYVCGLYFYTGVWEDLCTVHACGCVSASIQVCLCGYN